MKASTFETDGSGKRSDAEVPDGLTDAAHAARDALIEMVAEADDTLMEQFFEAGTLSQGQLEQGLRTAVVNRRIFPLVCTSALANIGLQPSLDAIVIYLPSPADHPLPAVARDGGETTTYDAGEGAAALAFVWKTIADPFAGRITLFRVGAGTLAADMSIHNATRGTTERLGGLSVLQGKQQTPVDEVKAGDLGAVPSSRKPKPPIRLHRKIPRRCFHRSSSLSRCCPMRSSRRAVATRKRSAAHCNASRRRTQRFATIATRRRNSCCCRARDSYTSR